MTESPIDLAGSKILIVDDELPSLNVLYRLLTCDGYEISTVPSGEIALRTVSQFMPDLILLDIHMPPGMDGCQVCRRLKSDDAHRHVPVIFMTAYDRESESAVRCFEAGGVDYIQKPFQEREVLARVKAHLRISRLTRMLSEQNAKLTAANESLQREIANRERAEAQREQAKAALRTAEEQLSVVSQLNAVGFIGQSDAIKTKVLKPLQSLQHSGRIPVLITGESGTGKELIARAIHYGGQRASGPFIAVNCAAIPTELVESELLGHVKGAFTGATKDKLGKFEAANGGTIFLDEIGDMGFDVQAKILRVLQEKAVVKVGDHHPKPIDVRVIAATNKNLETEVASGRFREDLYYRLAGIRITLPALRDRQEDIVLLALHFLKKAAAERDIQPPTIDPEALSTLKRYDFPGNVRQLEHIINAALTFSHGADIRPEHLDLTAPERHLPPREIINTASPQPVVPTDRVGEEARILEFVRQHGRITKADVQRILATSAEHASYRLKKMNQTGLLKRLGPRSSAYYILP